MTLFCKDCKHMVPTISPQFARCRKGNSEQYLVTGDEKLEEFCATMRINRCGPEGKLFEPINLEQDESTQAAAREYSGNLLRIVELEKTLQSAIKTLEYCAADPMTLAPFNNAQHVVAMSALPDLRAVLAKGKA